MIIDWKIWAGGLCMLLAAAGWLYVGHVRAERDLAVMRARALSRENAGLAAEVEANGAALISREAERARLAAENAALAAKLKEVYEHDPESRAWADVPCPDGVLECLRR